jgi:hypothetical protein
MLAATKILIRPLRLNLFGLLLLMAPCILLRAQIPASSIPALVQEPHGINLGNTSFFDGFSSLKPGVAVLDYFQYNHANSLTNSYGGNSSSFDHPVLNSTIDIAQISWASKWSIKGNRLGMDFILPIVGLSSSYGPNGGAFTSNGTQLGDITAGPFIQFKPVMVQHHPVLSVRLAVDFIAPTGGFDKRITVNQSSGFWSLNPYFAATFLPGPKWEFSTRTHYLYNFQTSQIAGAPPIPGFVFSTGQAGQAIFPNFDGSYRVAKKVTVGGNGYALVQLKNNRINDINLPDSGAKSLYLGPGVHWEARPKLTVNFNVYLPVTTRNLTTGPEINIQIIHPF